MKCLPLRAAIHRGFTLIEVMITVAIVAILASVAYPSYRDYIVRSRLVDATNGLTALRADMERHFQDNRTYATVGTFTSPCVTDRTAGNFVVNCVGTPTGTAYLLHAVGSTGTAVSGFELRLSSNAADGQNGQTTQAIGSVTGWSATVPAACWVLKRGQAC